MQTVCIVYSKFAFGKVLKFVTDFLSTLFYLLYNPCHLTLEVFNGLAAALIDFELIQAASCSDAITWMYSNVLSPFVVWSPTYYRFHSEW
jgi:hypothetical protein